MYICDWYNPVKGHAQYSLRDERRDRKSGRIWRIMPKEAEPVNPPKIYGSSLPQLLNLLKRPEYRYRYWAKREIREMEPIKVKTLTSSPCSFKDLISRKTKVSDFTGKSIRTNAMRN